MLSAFPGLCGADKLKFGVKTPPHLPCTTDTSVRLPLKYNNLKLESNFDEYKITKICCSFKLSWSCGISHLSLVKTLFEKNKLISHVTVGIFTLEFYLWSRICFWSKSSDPAYLLCFTSWSSFGICKLISFRMKLKLCSRSAHDALLLLMGI